MLFLVLIAHPKSSSYLLEWFRLGLYNISSAQGHRFAEVTRDLTEKI